MPSPSSDYPGALPLAGQLVVFTGKLSSLSRKDARALVDPPWRRTRRRRQREDDDAGDRRRVAQTSARRRNKLKRAEDLTAEGHAHIQVLSEEQFCRLAGRADARGPEASVSRDARPARALSVTPRGSPPIPDQVRDHQAGASHQRRHLLRVSRPRGDQAGERRDQPGACLFAPWFGRCSPRGRGSWRSTFISMRRRRRFSRCSGRSRPGRRLMPALRSAHRAVAEDYFRIASALDDGDEGKQDQAAAAYRKALEIDPYLVAALINLANIHYTRDELAEAQALYERAIGLESDFFEAHFNLGQHLSRPGPLSGGAGLLPGGAAPKPLLRRHPLLSRGDLRKAGALARGPTALACVSAARAKGRVG